MQLVLPDLDTRESFRINAKAPLNDEEFFDFCMKNPDLRIERATGFLSLRPRWKSGLKTARN